jgi:hypothetical protein
MKNAAIIVLLWLIFSLPARAHVGSPDVFMEGSAGPYRLFVTVRVPQVIPGIAQIEIRSESNDVREIQIAPMQLTGPGSKYAPTPDVAERSKSDPQFFTGSLWLMEFGSLQVRVDVDGTRGKGQLAVPVPAIAQRTLAMQKPLGILLAGLMLLLGFAVISIAGAAVREGDLPAGANPPAFRMRRARIATVTAAAVVFAILFIGGEWWRADAKRFAGRVYTPPELDAELQSGGHLVLRQRTVRIPNGNPRRPADEINFDNLMLDHDHLMHFFLIRAPEMDSFWHLHPARAGDGSFSDDLPSLPGGHYQLFADVVLSSGFPVTMIGQLDVPEISGKPLTGDDSGIVGTGISKAASDAVTYEFPDGSRMIWQRGDSPLIANMPLSFRFLVEDNEGKPAGDLEPYMGMAVHAEIIRSDGSVFAHVHPSGSVSMAALDLAQTELTGAAMAGMPGMNMPGMAGAPQKVGPEISFPYGFPKAGRYRIFVQIKRAGHIETAIFDANVS